MARLTVILEVTDQDARFLEAQVNSMRHREFIVGSYGLTVRSRVQRLKVRGSPTSVTIPVLPDLSDIPF